MRRLIPLAVLLLAGCGPKAEPTGQPASPTLDVKPPTTAKPEPKPEPTKKAEPTQKAEEKKTFSRDDIRAWWDSGAQTTDTAKAKFGRPTATFEKTVPGFRSATRPELNTNDFVTVYEYAGLSVDADGSGKVDAKAVLTFYKNGGKYKLEFVP